MLQCPWNETVALLLLKIAEHGKSLTGSCLAIGEDGGVLAFEEAIDMSPADGIIDLFLPSMFAEDHIEGVFIFAIIEHVIVVADGGWVLRGSKPAEDLDIAGFVLAFLHGVLHRDILVEGAFHERFGEIDGYLVDLGLLAGEVVARGRGGGGGGEGGENVVGGVDHNVIIN